jgi:signal transduction histidine kinase
MTGVMQKKSSVTSGVSEVSRRILIVEDEPEILAAYKDILSGQAKVPALKSSRSKPAAPAQTVVDDGFEVVAVTSGEEALKVVKQAMAEKKPFALGFFDVLLGSGIDGIETVKRIHDLDKDMYAVLVTAYQDRHVDAIQEVFGKEFEDRWDYLNKPFSEGEILQKARSMVSMWNIRRREIALARWLDELRRKLGENEKMLTIAAVARSVGHEFGNILLQIMGRADLSRNGSEEDMRKGLDTILVATEHAAKVLDRFKSLAKPHHTHERHATDVASAVREAVALIDHELERQHIQTEIHLGDLPAIEGNHSTLVQVFMNLIINSLHAIGNSEKTGGRIEICGKATADEVEVTVRDTGPGIPGDKWESVFEPFYTTKGDSGTGLGLAICKEITEITHGGKISVSNHPEGGAIFKLVFPIIEEGS